MAVASRWCPPQIPEGVDPVSLGIDAEPVFDPLTGFLLGHKTAYNNDTGVRLSIWESVTGHAVGNESGLIRITSA